MYHSVTIGDKNSWDDWHLISKDRPYIAQPTPKTKYVELAGASGSIDLTEALTGLPTYNDRTGSLTFIIDYDYWENWYDVYNDISNYLNGYRYKLMLEDEPYCYYIGRFSVSSYAPGNSASSPWATITINYTLYPYKYKLEDVLVATLKKDETISEYPSAVESEVIVTDNMLFEVAPTFYLYGIDGDFGLTIRDSESATQVDGKGILRIEDYYCVIDFQVRNNSTSMPEGLDTWADYIPEDNEFVNAMPTAEYYGKCNLWYFARVTYEGGEVVYTPKIVLASFGKAGLKNKVKLLDIDSYFAASEYTTGVTADGNLPTIIYIPEVSAVRLFVLQSTSSTGGADGYSDQAVSYGQGYVDGTNDGSTFLNSMYFMEMSGGTVTSTDLNNKGGPFSTSIYYTAGDCYLSFVIAEDGTCSYKSVPLYMDYKNDLSMMDEDIAAVMKGNTEGWSTKGPANITEYNVYYISCNDSDLESYRSGSTISSIIDQCAAAGKKANSISGLSAYDMYTYAIVDITIHYIDYSDNQREYDLHRYIPIFVCESAYGGIDEDNAKNDVVDWQLGSKGSTHIYYEDGSDADLPRMFDDRQVYIDSTTWGSYPRSQAGHDDNMWMYKTVSTQEESYIQPEDDGSPYYETEYKVSRTTPVILSSYKPGSIEITKEYTDGNPQSASSQVVGELHTSFASIDDYHGNSDISVAYLSTFRDYSVLKESQTKKLKNFSANPVNSPVYEGDASLYYRHIWNPEVGELAIRSITTFFKASSKDSGETAGDGTVDSKGVDSKGFSPSWSGEQWFAVDGDAPYLWVYERIEYNNGVIMLTDAHIAAAIHAYNAIVDTDSSGNAVREARAIQFISLERAYTFTDEYTLDPTSVTDMNKLQDWQVRTENDYVTPPSGGAMAMFIRYKVHHKGYAPYLYVRFRVHYNANDLDDIETLYFKLPPATFNKLRHYQITYAKPYYLKTDKKDNITRSTKGWKDYANHVAKDRPYLWSYQEVKLSNGETYYTTPRIIATVRDNTKLSDNASSASKLIWHGSMSEIGLLEQDDNVKRLDPDWTGSDSYNKQFYIKYEIDYHKKVNESEGSTIVKRQYTYFRIHSSDFSYYGIKSVSHKFLSSAKSSGVKRGDSGWTANWQNVKPDKQTPFLWAYQIITLYNDQVIKTTPKMIAKWSDVTNRGENHFVNTTPGKLLSAGYTFDDDYNTGPIKLKGNRHTIVYGSRKNQSVPNRTGQLRMKYWKEVL